MHAVVKEANGQRFLLVASDSRRAEETTLKFAGVADATARCLGDAGTNAPLLISNGEVKLKLPPLGAAVYELKPR